LEVPDDSDQEDDSAHMISILMIVMSFSEFEEHDDPKDMD
jgi:hypothetical protein